MIGMFLLVAAAQAPEIGMIPAEAGEPLFRYVSCLFQPFDGRTYIPASLVDREAMVARNLERCAETRETSASDIDAIMARNPDYADLGVRRDAISSFFATLEERVRLAIVEHERFVSPTGIPVASTPTDSNNADDR